LIVGKEGVSTFTLIVGKEGVSTVSDTFGANVNKANAVSSQQYQIHLERM